MLNPLNILSKFIKSGNQKELDKLQKVSLLPKGLARVVLKTCKITFEHHPDILSASISEWRVSNLLSYKPYKWHQRCLKSLYLP